MKTNENTPPKGGRPVETIVIQRLDNAGTPSGTLLIKIPPTMAEHNMIIALLQRLRIDYPGAWFCVQQWERQQFHGPIAVQRRKQEADENIPDAIPIKEDPKVGVKEVTRKYLGLPEEDTITDVPQ